MTEVSFPLKSDFIELFKLLKVTGLCESGGEAKEVITQSLVKVDGEVELRKGCKIRAGQTVHYADQSIAVQ